MQKKIRLSGLIIDLFEGGEGAGSGATAPAAGEQTGEMSTPAAGEMETTQEVTPEEREAKFHDMINGEYRDLYSKEVQQIISKRIKDSKAMEQQLSDQQAVIDRMAQKYGITDGNMQALGEAIDNDYALWEDAADQAGMSVEQYTKFQALQRQNADLIRQEQARVKQMQDQQMQRKLMGEAQQLKSQYPSFDLPTELANPAFAQMIKNGISLDHAYKVIHFDDLQLQTAKAVAGQTEKAVTENIRANGTRPMENGSRSGYGASETKIDVHKLTKQGRQELIERARRGELITF